MADKITNLLLLTFLIPTIISKEIQFQDQNNLSKENLSDDSKPRSYIDVRKTPKHYGLKHGKLLDEDSRSNEQGKQKNKQRSHNNKVNLTKNLKQKTSEHQERNKNLSKDLVRLKPQKTSIHQNQERNLEERSISSREDETEEHLGRTKNLDEDSRPTQSEQNDLDEYINTKDFVHQDTRPSLDRPKTERHINLNKGSPIQTIILEQNDKNRSVDDEDNKPYLDEQKTESHNSLNKNSSQIETIILEQKDKNRNFNDVNNKPSLNTENYNLNNETTPMNEQTTAHHRHLNVDRRAGHRDHTAVADNDFEYMVAVLKGNTYSYVCAGALIDESWVLTAASGIHLFRETIRFLRIRLSSINYKKGGTLLPIKYLETHPYFNSSMPSYDLALIMLSKPVRFTVNMRSIRLQMTPKEVTSTHYIMTSWPGVVKPETNKSQSTEIIKHHRILSVTHLHPSDPGDCAEELKGIGAAEGVMCLENSMQESCMRDTGAPIVINRVLWGIISSWKPEDCDEEDSSVFATLVSARNISSWIHATVHGHRWHPKNK